MSKYINKQHKIIQLWLHMLDKHGGIWYPPITLEELIKEHEEDHEVGIDNHDINDWSYSLKNAGITLSESEN